MAKSRTGTRLAFRAMPVRDLSKGRDGYSVEARHQITNIAPTFESIRFAVANHGFKVPILAIFCHVQNSDSSKHRTVPSPLISMSYSALRAFNHAFHLMNDQSDSEVCIVVVDT